MQQCLLLHATRCHDSTWSDCISMYLPTSHKLHEAKTGLLTSLSLGVLDMLTTFAASLINKRVSGFKAFHTNRTRRNTEHNTAFLISYQHSRPYISHSTSVPLHLQAKRRESKSIVQWRNNLRQPCDKITRNVLLLQRL